MSAMPEGTQVLNGVVLEIGGNLREAAFVKRLTRFSCLVMLDGQEIAVHFPNSGRHRELLVPGRKVLLREEKRAGRKTDFDLIMVRHGHILVSVDARMPSRLFARALEQHAVLEFKDYRQVFREVPQGQSRLDFLLENGHRHFVEVKSVTLMREGCALFPDAPTIRGQRHLQELMDAVKNGDKASNVFVIQREDVKTFVPNDEADPEYGHLLRRAAGKGVRILAYSCRVKQQRIQIKSRVQVELS